MRLTESTKKMFVAAMVAASFFVTSHADTSLAGKAGAELKEAVAASYRPCKLVSAIELDDAIAELWSSVPLGFPVNIAHRKWWELTPIYGDSVSRNLYNTVAIPSALVVERGQ
ncbi:MAG: hypothetical protein J1E63_04500, partial [Muribaculaceae bacterium]|nr:hypothetical protein [Muribaculaceae bacterium]